MRVPANTILVIGHRNPDTDAACSAFSYADFLNRTSAYDTPVAPVVLGELTPQARFVFERARLTPPPMIDNLFPRVGDVASYRVDTLTTHDRLRDASELLIRSDRSMLPVLDPQGTLQGVFSHRRDASRYLFGLDVVPLLASLLDWTDILEMQGMRPLGANPRDVRLRGELHLALDDGGAWQKACGADDILVASRLPAAGSIPEVQWPHWIVIAGGDAASIDATQVAALNRRGIHLAHYQHSMLDFIAGLMPQVRVGVLSLDIGPCVGESDLVQDVREMISAARHAVPVLDQRGKLVAVVSRADLQRTPRRRVILIDHFESAQAAPGIENAEIIEIVDHHRVGDIQTAAPVRVECRPLGSSSTIIALRFFESRLEPPAPIAMLLLGGLVSDTLSLRSPTTTPIDRDVANELARRIGVPLDTFGREVLKAGDDLLISDPSEIWNRDQKAFSVRNRSFAVAQLETVSIEDIPPERLETFAGLLHEDFARSSHVASYLFLTDVFRGESWIHVCEASEAEGAAAASFGAGQSRPGWIRAPGVVSRKKQIIPPLMKVLSQRNL